MLTSLFIENFAIVAKLELDFEHGMTAFTGETGAGKSIMIDALMLALGGRGDATILRPGAEKCDISACFHIDKNSEPAQWLAEHECSNEEEMVLLRRVINSDGRSKSFINGQPFTLQKVKELSELLVDIHGQHQHQRLLQHTTHREQLDTFSAHHSLLDEVSTAYKLCQNTQKRLEKLQSQGSVQERVSLLKFQIEELAELNLQAGEMHALNEEHQLLHHAQDYLQDTQLITSLLNAEDAPNICQQLNHILQALSKLPAENPRIKNTAELINNALINCEEAIDEMTTFAEHVQLDPERLDTVENRISMLHQTARKYHVDANQLADHLQQLESELHTLENAEHEQAELEGLFQEQLSAYEQAALRLRASRQKHAALLAEEISATIRQLGMPQGYIQLDFTPLEKMQPHGLDKVEYKVCANPGMTPDTLAKIASGGELSRISLAIQMIAAQRGATPTLLFDEVDVGIGGATAALVGQLLRKLGERLQLFCVTHQPQVASAAHHHFMVEKYSDNAQTFSKITQLEKPEKINEIARMLGGLTITEQTRKHASELLGY